MVRMATLGPILPALSLKRRVSISQTGVSREGTEEIMQILLLNEENSTGFMSLSITSKSGALSPTFNSFPKRVRGFPFIVIIPTLSSILGPPFPNIKNN